MAARNVIMPSQREPLVDLNNGLMNPVWYRFFSDFHERTGGGATDKVEEAYAGADGAQVAADAAAAAAEAAQAVIDFAFEFGF